MSAAVLAESRNASAGNSPAASTRQGQSLQGRRRYGPSGPETDTTRWSSPAGRTSMTWRSGADLGSCVEDMMRLDGGSVEGQQASKPISTTTGLRQPFLPRLQQECACACPGAALWRPVAPTETLTAGAWAHALPMTPLRVCRSRSLRMLSSSTSERRPMHQTRTRTALRRPRNSPLQTALVATDGNQDGSWVAPGCNAHSDAPARRRNFDQHRKLGTPTAIAGGPKLQWVS
jgi:hypothetical protein